MIIMGEPLLYEVVVLTGGSLHGDTARVDNEKGEKQYRFSPFVWCAAGN